MQRVKAMVVFCAGRKLFCSQSSQSQVVFGVNLDLKFS